MKALKYISALLLLTGLVFSVQAQVVRKKKTNEKEEAKTGQVSERMQSFFDEKKTSDADLQWQRVIYRSLNLDVAENMPLYYPEEPDQDGMNLFFIIMKQLSNNTLAAYEYLDGREMFTEQYLVKVSDILDRFHIIHAKAKGSTEKNPKFTIENADIPANEVLSYYILEKYEFNRVNSKVTRHVEAICPVLHRSDEFGGEPIKYPMFWVKMSDLRPFIVQQYVFTDNDNNVLKTSLDDYFMNNMYKGEIYKYKNLRNLSMMQMYPNPDKLKQAQDSIEKRLASFDQNIWVPTREELKARAEAEQAKNDSIAALQNGEEVKASNKDDNKRSTVRSTRAKSKRADKSSSSSSTKKAKVKQTKVKSSSSNAARSVRRTR